MTWAVCAQCPHTINHPHPKPHMNTHEANTGHQGWAVETETPWTGTP